MARPSWTTTPSRRAMQRSTRSTNEGSWVATTMVAPSAWTSSKMPSSAALPLSVEADERLVDEQQLERADQPERDRGVLAQAAAERDGRSSARCERPRRSRSASRSSPTGPRRAGRRRTRGARGRTGRRRAPARRAGSSPRRGPASVPAGAPRRRSRRRVRSSSPAARRRKVDLPEPLCPMSATDWPRVGATGRAGARATRSRSPWSRRRPPGSGQPSAALRLRGLTGCSIWLPPPRRDLVADAHPADDQREQPDHTGGRGQRRGLRRGRRRRRRSGPRGSGRRRARRARAATRCGMARRIPWASGGARPSASPVDAGPPSTLTSAPPTAAEGERDGSTTRDGDRHLPRAGQRWPPRRDRGDEHDARGRRRARGAGGSAGAASARRRGGSGGRPPGRAARCASSPARNSAMPGQRRAAGWSRPRRRAAQPGHDGRAARGGPRGRRATAAPRGGRARRRGAGAAAHPQADPGPLAGQLEGELAAEHDDGAEVLQRGGEAELADEASTALGRLERHRADEREPERDQGGGDHDRQRGRARRSAGARAGAAEGLGGADADHVGAVGPRDRESATPMSEATHRGGGAPT